MLRTQFFRKGVNFTVKPSSGSLESLQIPSNSSRANFGNLLPTLSIPSSKHHSTQLNVPLQGDAHQGLGSVLEFAITHIWALEISFSAVEPHPKSVQGPSVQCASWDPGFHRRSHMPASSTSGHYLEVTGMRGREVLTLLCQWDAIFFGEGRFHISPNPTVTPSRTSAWGLSLLKVPSGAPQNPDDPALGLWEPFLQKIQSF